MAYNPYITKTNLKNEYTQTAPSVDANGFSSSVSFSESQITAAYPVPTAHHYTEPNEDTGVHARGLLQSSASATDCPWNSYDNVPPTPAPASSYDLAIEGQDYRIGYDSDYNQDAAAPGALQGTGYTGFVASPRPTTPLGALATPPAGYEWYISPAYEAYLVPLAGTSPDSTHGNSTSISIPMALAPYGLPTPPSEADIGHSYSRNSGDRRGLAEWIAANPGREFVDILDEEDRIWTRKKASGR